MEGGGGGGGGGEKRGKGIKCVCVLSIMPASILFFWPKRMYT